MRYRQAGFFHYNAAEKDNIHVERPRRVIPFRSPSFQAFDLLQPFEQFMRSSIESAFRRAIIKLPSAGAFRGLRFVKRRDRNHRYPRYLFQPFDSGGDMPRPVAEVGAEGKKHLVQSEKSFRISLRLSAYPPITWKTILRLRGRLSKSTRTICCHVPRISLPFVNGTVSEGPSSAARTCEKPLPSFQRSLWL